MASQISSRWTYPLVGVTARKSLPRVALGSRTAFELTGVDGSLQGGLRPFPGFVKAHEFHGGEGDVTDFSVFELRLDSDSSAFGVAYIRGGKVHVDIDFPIDGIQTHLIHDDGDIQGPIEAVTWGRVAYILVRGFPPVAVRGFRKDQTDQFSVINPAGPGPKPRSGCVRWANEVGNGDPALIDPVPLKDNIEIPSGSTFDNRTWTEVDTDGDSEVDDLNSDGLVLHVANRPNQDNPTYVNLRKGNYSFAYSFYDSRSGRRSQLSDVIELAEEDFPADDSGELPNYTMEWAWHLYPDSKYGDGSDSLGLRIPKRFEDKWDRIYLWRSVRVEGAGGTYVAAIMHLDKIWPFRSTIPEPDEGQDPGTTGHVYPYTLEDSALVVQDVRLDHAAYFDEMPRGGTGTVLNDVFYVADIVPAPVLTEEDPGEEGQEVVLENVYPNEALEGVGEIRWSQTQDPHPELFHWSGKHTPSTVSERPLRLFTVGDAVMAVSRNRTMLARRAGQFVVVDEVHEGYGTVARDSVAAVDDAVWFLSEKGLKAVSSKGYLSDVPDLDELVTQWWGGTNRSVSMGFDHRAGCLWVLNPLKQRAVVLWMETPALTELEEVPFALVRSGPYRDSYGVFQKRALFLDPSNACLWMADHDRKVQGIRLLKVPGPCRSKVLAVAGDTVTLEGSPALEKGMWVHLEGGSRWKVLETFPPVSGSRQARLEGSPLPQVGDELVLSPVVLRWSGGILTGQNEEGEQFLSGADMFRSRHLSSVGCVFDSVEGEGSFRGCSFFGTDQSPSHYGSSIGIESGLPGDYSAFGTYGVSHSSLSPGVEILCADLDFRLLSVICRGRIDATDRAR